MNPIDVLGRGELEVLGRLPFSSNYVFLVKAKWKDDEVHGVYKPTRGERPLWDFPVGTLADREVAAYQVSEVLGWGVVPPTVLRSDAPLGRGSVQLFINHDPERHYFTLLESHASEMVRFAALDVVINNADRKSGHVVQDEADRLWGVDHGLSFNVEPKLRTVIWAFADQPVPDDLRQDISRLAASLAPGGPTAALLDGLLATEEIAETKARAEVLLEQGVFPSPEGPFSVPWPLV